LKLKRTPKPAQTSRTLFDSLDMSALSALCAEPLGTFQRLAAAAGMSVQTFRKRIAALSDSKVLLRVGARTSPSALGLQNTPVFATVPFNKLQFVEKACDLHPYTRYRGRCLGSTNGLFLLFGIPPGMDFQLAEFLDELVHLDLMKEYRILSSTAEPIYTNPDLSTYQFNSDVWRFNMKKWAGELGSHKEELQPPAVSVLSKLDLRDLRLVRELTIEARKEQKLLARKLSVPEYYVSRRLKFMSENRVIPSYEVFLGRGLFRFAPGALFDVRCDLNATRIVASGVKVLSFQTSMLPTKEGFILFTSLPTTFFTEMGSALLKHCSDVRMMWTDYDSSMRYYFDEAPYLEGTGQWNTNRDFAIDNPLADLKNAMKKEREVQS